MTSLKDAIEESDQFWIDIANGLPEYHGLGAKGELNHMYGKKHDEEWKKNVSDKLKSLHELDGEENPWHARDISGEKNGFYNKKHSEETRKQISESLNRHYANTSPEDRKKTYGRSMVGEKNSFYNKEHSEESKKQISESLNRHYANTSPEDRKKTYGRSMVGEKNPMFGIHLPPNRGSFKKGHVPWNTGKSCIPKRDPRTGRFLPN